MRTTFDHKRKVKKKKIPERIQTAEGKTIEATTTDARALRTPGFPGLEKAAFDAVLFGEFFRKDHTNIIMSDEQGGVRRLETSGDDVFLLGGQ